MKKKFILLSLAILTCLSLTACGTDYEMKINEYQHKLEEGISNIESAVSENIDSITDIVGR